MSTETEIANRTLSRLGQTFITSLAQQQSIEARLLNLFFYSTVDELLSEFKWSFAIERIALASVSTTNFTEFTYKYDLPNNYLKVINLISSTDYSDLEDNWRIEGKSIYTDLSPTYIKYVKRITNATELPPIFTEALVLRIAMKICMKLTQNRTLFNDIGREYSLMNLTAMGVLGSSDRQDPAASTNWSD